MLSEAYGVNAADIWEEGARAYPRRSDRDAVEKQNQNGNPYSDV